jgi:hypothetical protein
MPTQRQDNTPIQHQDNTPTQHTKTTCQHVNTFTQLHNQQTHKQRQQEKETNTF